MIIDIGGAGCRWAEVKINQCLRDDEHVATFLLDM